MTRTIKRYNKENAPLGSKFLYKRIERDGIVDMNLPTTDVLGYNEKWVYFFEIKVPK